VAVPEAAVDEERELAARDDDVRLPRQVRSVQAVAGAQAGQRLADLPFGEVSRPLIRRMTAERFSGE